jgi:glycosyltransferase involved in cell wall biosynthesis
MLKEPVSNDPQNPLLSVLIYNYYGECLRQCLDAIFKQSVLNNVEVIFIDNATSDDSWDIAVEYARKYDGLMTIKRNGRSGWNEGPNKRGGDTHDLNHCRRMARGAYVVTLCKDDSFLPEYIAKCLASMEADPFVSFDRVTRKDRNYCEWPSVKGVPRVNVLIHNYNYGRYLRQCLDSIFAQTYPNINIIFSDNSSGDESWDIAVEYERRHPGSMIIIRNRRNFGPAANLENCYSNIEGKYFCILCSDDALMPDFVSDCVRALETNPDAGYAMTHRTIIDENGSRTEEPPFYNQSCIIQGPEQAAVYMMAAVNPSISQVMYSRAKAQHKLPAESLTSRWFAQRLLDFRLCCNYSMVYIQEPLLLHRVHSASDSSMVSASLLEAFGQFLLPHQFADMALATGNMDKAAKRLPQALEKLSKLCLRYCVQLLSAKDERSAFRYFHLAIAIMPDINADPIFIKLDTYWVSEAPVRAKILESLVSTDNLTTRSVSYDPPPGSVPIRVV